MFEQPSLLPSLSFSVSEVTRYLRALLESDEFLGDLWVRGEISNLSRPRSGHVYFTLKDAGSALRCVVWRSAAVRLPINLQDGMAVEAHGSIGIYDRDGQYQLYVDFVRSAGEGLLYQKFIQLKEKLQSEGLFDEERKRPIPDRPKLIGIVTSTTAAALQDVLNTIQQRNPLVQVYLSPSSVQGDAAPAEIVRAIERLNREVSPDVILLVRGGGSLEDLWAFNDERVVRAVVASWAPVVTGVGHETDFTLVDFASDVRAPTPTGAAVYAVPEMGELIADLQGLKQRLAYALEDWLSAAQNQITHQNLKLQQLSPHWRIQNGLQRVDELNQRLDLVLRSRMSSRQASLLAARERLQALNPLAVLQRGYALVLTAEGTPVRSYLQVEPDDNVDIKLADGKLAARVLRRSKE